MRVDLSVLSREANPFDLSNLRRWLTEAAEPMSFGAADDDIEEDSYSDEFDYCEYDDDDNDDNDDDGASNSDADGYYQSTTSDGFSGSSFDVQHHISNTTNASPPRLQAGTPGARSKSLHQRPLLGGRSNVRRRTSKSMHMGSSRADVGGGGGGGGGGATNAAQSGSDFWVRLTTCFGNLFSDVHGRLSVQLLGM